MDEQSKRLVVNAITLGRVPFVVLFMVLAVIDGYWPAWWLAVLATASLAIVVLIVSTVSVS